MRTFDVQFKFLFKTIVKGHKAHASVMRAKQDLRRKLRKAGIKDSGCISVIVSEKGINPPL